mmetsp:Transcript_54773/g.90770  ORF Transcript_54773/g.90770 Transcript_54773/m.90770 type:complete len:421 (+) Transcript_54773:23-1285(+)|eukprot:CAMPEP_0119333080 /NCGR_PEP_ID=MMETSP1333-20130426/84308_1 /TAXON_ID=418940 /ORGANISM="Scyphosphaera apsteinii, Strain RCC1455" /LENGTH=420 /DNA_ID=CAMNT_0007343043 /DNA_START=16 /DNA_END=1278 /DNA_ORIENTATION=-
MLFVHRVAPHGRRLSTYLKASPTVQRLIREHGLSEVPLKGSGPKGTVTPSDVQAAAMAKQMVDEAALLPISIDFKPMVGHLLETSSLPTSATTNKKELVEYYKKMYTMRRMEIAADVLYKGKFVKGFCHLYDGQEAVGMGIEAATTFADSIVTSYRDHTYQFTRGSSVAQVLGELLGKYIGPAKGKGGSMHMYSAKNNFYGGNGIVGAQVPIGAGLGFAHKYRGDGGVAFTLYGDGAANQGQIFEVVNMAALWQLPVIFVCENNQYGMGTATHRGSFDTEYHARGQYIPGIKVDGMNVLAVREAVKLAKAHALEHGPVMMEMDTYRYHGHSMSDPGITYRTRDEVSGVRSARDPVQLVKNWLTQYELVTSEEIKSIEQAVKKEVEEGVEAAKAAALPPHDELVRDIYFQQGGLEPRMCNL